MIIISSAATREDCHHLMKMYDKNVNIANVRDEAGFPVVYWPSFSDESAEIVSRLVQNCLSCIRINQLYHEPVYPETIILSRIGAGGSYSRHADNCRQNEYGQWVPNHTPNRVVSAIYYLNSEFEGGETVFDQISIKPFAGLLVVFPSNSEYVHEVRPVLSGVRYTMPIWFTSQKQCALIEF